MVRQNDDVKNQCSAFKVPHVFSRCPAESASVLTLTLSALPGRSMLTLDDGSEVEREQTPTIKLVQDKSVYFLTYRAHYLQRGDVLSGKCGRTSSSQNPEKKSFQH